MTVREYMRMKCLSEMSDEAKKVYLQACSNDIQVLQSLKNQQETLEKIRQQGNFWRDFASNVAGNAVYDGVLWVASRISKLIK